jgi:ribosomal protein S16
MSQSNETQENQSSEELRQVLDTLTVDQIRFVIARQGHHTDKEAAEEIGIKPNRVSQWKHNGAEIDRAVRLMAYDGLTTALHLRRRSLSKAMAVKVRGLDDDDARLRQGVATEIIEWEMGRATQKVESTNDGTLTIEVRGGFRNSD